MNVLLGRLWNLEWQAPEPELDSSTPPPIGYTSAAAPPWSVGIHFIDAATAFKAGFFGGLGAMAAWVVVWLVVGAILFPLGLTFSRLLNW